MVRVRCLSLPPAQAQGCNHHMVIINWALSNIYETLMDFLSLEVVAFMEFDLISQKVNIFPGPPLRCTHSCCACVLWAWLLLPCQLLAGGSRLLRLGSWCRRTQTLNLSTGQKSCEDSLRGVHTSDSFLSLSYLIWTTRSLANN